MAMTAGSGPFMAYGSTADLLSTTAGVALGGNSNIGVSSFYHGVMIPDPRFLFDKEKAGGYRGIMPGLFSAPFFRSIDQTPMAHSATNIAAAQHTVAGVPLTLAGPSIGVSTNIPIVPYTAAGNSYNGVAVVTPALCLDFGFGLATLVSGSTNVTLGQTSTAMVGMPLIFAAIATTTTPFMSVITKILSATAVQIADPAPFSAASGGARVGTGNVWQPNEGTFSEPTGAWPFIGSGPSLVLDPRQTIARGVVITCSNALGAGGIFAITGYDIYNQFMSELITVAPGSALAAYGKKAFKYITGVASDTTDGTYNYSVGTSDVFGFATRLGGPQRSEIWWAGLLNTALTGLVGGLGTNTPSTSTTNDVRGTIQVSAIGGGSGIGSTATNGSSSGVNFTGNLLTMAVQPDVIEIISATPANSQTLFGNAQA